MLTAAAAAGGIGARSLIRWDSDDPSIRFSHAHLALQAAMEGVGIAMARRVLAADDLASGRLLHTAPTCPSVAARFAYYFVTRDEPDARGRTLISWLKAELAALEVSPACAGGCAILT